jgi:hypothetical protein
LLFIYEKRPFNSEVLKFLSNNTFTNSESRSRSNSIGSSKDSLSSSPKNKVNSPASDSKVYPPNSVRKSAPLHKNNNYLDFEGHWRTDNSFEKLDNNFVTNYNNCKTLILPRGFNSADCINSNKNNIDKISYSKVYEEFEQDVESTDEGCSANQIKIMKNEFIIGVGVNDQNDPVPKLKPACSSLLFPTISVSQYQEAYSSTFNKETNFGDENDTHKVSFHHQLTFQENIKNLCISPFSNNLHENFRHLFNLKSNIFKSVRFIICHNELLKIKIKNFSNCNEDHQFKIKSIYNLKGSFYKEEENYIFYGKVFYSFSIINIKSTRRFYTDNEKEYKFWINFLKKNLNVIKCEDKYDIQESIGKGRHGEVYEAYDRINHRKVAIRIVPKNNLQDEDFQQLWNEIEILKISKHPNIIKLYEAWEDYENLYLVTEFCKGGDLITYLKNKEFHLQEKISSKIIHKISTAIFYLHSYGIIHRDLRSENVLIKEITYNKKENFYEMDIKLIDFSLSKFLGPSEFSCDTINAVGLVAPELLSGKMYDKKIDLWNLGIISYQLITGLSINNFKTKCNDKYSSPYKFLFNNLEEEGIVEKISKEGMDFIKSLLNINSAKRISLYEVLTHEWIKNLASPRFQKIIETRENTIENYIYDENLLFSIFDIFTTLD